MSSPANFHLMDELPYCAKLTDDVCNAHPGTLTAIDLTCARELLSAWADWDVVGSSSHAGSGRERAILQEGLLKRMIDERNAGNTGAIARTEDFIMQS